MINEEPSSPAGYRKKQFICFVYDRPPGVGRLDMKR